MSLSKLKAPNTYLLIFIILLLTAGLTWIIPGGKYQTELNNGKNAVVPGTFEYIDSQPQGFYDALMAPINGFVDAALIIGFVLIVGGTFFVLQHTGAVDAAIKAIVNAHHTSQIIQKLVIPIFMTIFSLAGAVFGMSEETIPFVLLFIPLALALGYDSVTGVAIPFVGAGAGFAGAFINPFTVGVAQGIAELPPLSGIQYRIICWVVVTFTAIVFVQRYANRIKSNPEISVTFEIDEKKREQLHLKSAAAFTGINAAHKTVLLIFLAGMIVLVFGVLEYGWYIKEISALFLLLGIVIGIAGRLKIKQITDAFVEGAAALIGTAMIIALARGILVIARDGQIIDTMLHYTATLIQSLHPVVSAQAMFITQTFINFFVPSGSGQAALTMPVMAPLSDLIGVSRQTAVLAFQFGDGFSNLIIPTSAVTMGVLALAEIPWEKWARWILPLEVLFLLVGFLLLIPPFVIGW